MNGKFIFVAYKPDSADYCRGCLMASYPSRFEVENDLNEEQLIKLWSKYLCKNANLDINEAGYQFYIFKDGVKLWNEYYACSWSSEDENESVEAERLINSIHEKACEMAGVENTKK